MKRFAALLIFGAFSACTFAAPVSNSIADGRFAAPEPAALAVLAVGLTTALRRRIR